MDIKHIESKEADTLISLSNDIPDSPFDNHYIFYSVMALEGFPITWGEGNGQHHGKENKFAIGAYTDSTDNQKKIKQIKGLIFNTFMLLHLPAMATVDWSADLVKGKKLDEVFPGLSANPEVSQEELEKIFLRTYERRKQINKNLGEEYEKDYIMDPKNVELYNNLKERGVEAASAEELQEILKRDVDRVLQQHPELKPDIN